MRNAHPAFISTSLAKAAVCAAWLLATSLSHAQTPGTSTEAAATSSAASDTQAELRDAVRAQLREKKLDEAYESWAQELRARAYVEYREAPQS